MLSKMKKNKNNIQQEADDSKFIFSFFFLQLPADLIKGVNKMNEVKE